MDRLYYQTITVPANTPVATPASQAWPLEDNELAEVTITIPDGHCGLTGFRLMRAQQQIVPFANNSYLVANDRTLVYPFDDEITSTGLVLEGYNTDIFAHTFYVTALVTNLPVPGENPPAEVVTPGALSSLQSYYNDELTPDDILSGSDLGLGSDTYQGIPPPVPTGIAPTTVKVRLQKRKTPKIVKVPPVKRLR